MEDVVDRIQSEWAEVRPGLDVSPMEVIGRISRLSRIIDKRLAENFGLHGIDQNWIYDVLATLRRGGEPFELSAGEIGRQTMVTTGAITNRIDRLEERGLVERAFVPTDRRRVMIRLTVAGRELVDGVAESHYAFESQLLSALGLGERRELAGALRSVLVNLGDVADPWSG